MATNNPWSDFFGSVNTGWNNMVGGINNALMPEQSQLTGNPSMDQFLVKYINDNKLNALTPSGHLNVEGTHGLQDVMTAAMEGDNKALAALIMGERAYQSSESDPKGIAAAFNNPAFIMGIQLMKGAGEGKNIGEAMAPAAEATQAFMTNQELRKQNKRLIRSKEGGIWAETLSGAQQQATTTQTGASTENIKAQTLNTNANTRLTYDQADQVVAQTESIEIQNMYQPALIEASLNASSLAAKAAEQNIGAFDAREERAAEKHIAELVNMGANTDLIREQIHIMGEELILKIDMNDASIKNLDAQTQQVIEQAQGQALANNITQGIIDKTKNKELALERQMDLLDVPEALRNEIIAAGGIESTEAMEKLNNYNASQSSNDELQMAKDWAMDVDLPLYDRLFGTDEQKDAVTRASHSAIITAAKAMDPQGKLTQENFKKAEIQYYQDGDFVYNNWGFRTFLGTNAIKMTENAAEYMSSEGLVKKAKGGAVQAGQPYLVGEEGPEVMVPNQSGNIVSNPATQGGYTWENAIIDNSPELQQIARSSGIEAAKEALKKFRPDLYV